LELEPIDSLAAGDPAPAFKVETLEGADFEFVTTKGRHVLLAFWASRSAPCASELPYWKAVHDAFGTDDRFVLIGLSLDGDADAARTFVDENGLDWTHGLLGEKGPVVAAYDLQGVPAAFLIGPDGRILARDLRAGRLLDAVRAALAR
jgi:peroxiredoxin